MKCNFYINLLFKTSINKVLGKCIVIVKVLCGNFKQICKFYFIITSNIKFYIKTVNTMNLLVTINLIIFTSLFFNWVL